MTSDELAEHISATYYRLRIGMAILAIAFPFVLLGIGWYGHGIPFLPSMSAYYFAPDPQVSDMREFPIRIWFVGFTWVIGCFLILYKGFTHGENRLLNLAGLCALGVALIPVTPTGCEECGFGWTLVHTALALTAFACTALAAWVFSYKTLQELEEHHQVNYQRGYSALSAVMVLAPMLAIVAALAYDWLTIIFETIGLFAFGAFWLVKTRELKKSNYEYRAMNRQLKAPRALSATEPLRMRVARNLDWEPITHELRRAMRSVFG